MDFARPNAGAGGAMDPRVAARPDPGDAAGAQAGGGSLVEPHACGIGGDLFAMVWDPEAERLEGYNGSGRSPRGLSYAALSGRPGEEQRLPLFGALAVSVPGAVGSVGGYRAMWRDLLFAAPGLPECQVRDGRVLRSRSGQVANGDLPLRLATGLPAGHQLAELAHCE